MELFDITKQNISLQIDNILEREEWMRENKLIEESIILIGPSGARKSTVAEILKNITGMPRLCIKCKYFLFY